MNLKKIKKYFTDFLLSFSKLFRNKDKSNDDDSIPDDHYPLY